MKKGFFATLIFLFAGFVQAQQCTQLTYVGTPFASITATASNGAANNETPISSPLTGTITLATPLPPNAVNLAVLPTSWSFMQAPFGSIISSDNTPTGPYGTFGAYGPFGGSTFVFSTDNNGNITTWTVTVVNAIGPGADPPNQGATIVSSQAGDTVEAQTDLSTISSSPLGVTTTTGSSSSAGTWTCPTSYSTNYTAPPPVVNPLQAQVTALTAQVATLTSQLATSKALATTQSNQLATDTSTIASLNSKITALQTQLTAAQKSASIATASVVDPLPPAKSGGGALGIEELAGLAILVWLKRRPKIAASQL